MRSSDVSFRNVVPEIENVPVEERKPIEVIEIKFPDGKVCAFPANDVNPESGRRYKDLYSRKYQAFKDGKPDPDRVKELESEIAERQAELDGLTKSKDDKRVQENLGYGKIKPDEDPHNTDKKLSIGTGGLPSPAPRSDPVAQQPIAPVLGQPKHENIV